MKRTRFRSSRDDDWWSFPESKPLAARGGIKAQSRRGAFGTQWWAKQWVAVLDGLSLGSRLQRGRSYARSGQVLELAVGSGRVTALVQGSRPKPYRATIEVTTLDAPAWDRVFEAISAEARFAAKLLSGEMPQDVERAFTAAGTSLFPRSARDLTTACSCPDASNPCKHLAAVYYLLGEEFDRDPFLLFTLRGRSKDQILTALEPPDAVAAGSAAGETAEPQIAESLWTDLDVATFWDGGEAEPIGSSQPATPARRAVAPFPFWRGERPLADMLKQIDELAAEEAQRILGDDR